MPADPIPAVPPGPSVPVVADLAVLAGRPGPPDAPGAPRGDPCACGAVARAAVPSDVPAMVALIRELAAFERLSHLVQATPERLARQLFGAQPAAEAVVVDAPPGAAADGPLVAFALFFPNFSTFLAQPGLYLEDLYVQPAHRGRGIGSMLLRHLGALAVARGCGRFEWSVLDWNADAIAFYEAMGATVMPEWRICRVAGEGLQRLGGGAVRPPTAAGSPAATADPAAADGR